MKVGAFGERVTRKGVFLRRIIKGCILLELVLLLLDRSFARFCALRLQTLESLTDVDAEAERDVCMASTDANKFLVCGRVWRSEFTSLALTKVCESEERRLNSTMFAKVTGTSPKNS